MTRGGKWCMSCFKRIRGEEQPYLMGLGRCCNKPGAHRNNRRDAP